MSELSFPRRIAVLGSSGSIGRNALDVIAESNGKLQPVLLSVHNRTDILVEQVRQLTLRRNTDASSDVPKWVAVTGENADRNVLKQLPPDIEVFFGHEALCELVCRPEADIVLSAIVGSAGLTSTWAALEAGKTVALANKESLVMGGQLLTKLAKERGGKILPVDSEHCAVMQALQSRFHEDVLNSEVERIVLTASGGPFRTWTLKDLERVTVQNALQHPVWKMGKKITVDSATLMNKALEIIEARWLFDIPASKIGVMIHPQSVVHSMVEFRDGSVISQSSPPDMRLPIQLALNYPYRLPGPSLRTDWKTAQTLEFYPPDYERFAAIPLALEVAEKGGSAGTVLNAANEVAVNAFLEGQLPFYRIVDLCKTVLQNHNFEPNPALPQLLEIDRQTRKETLSFINKR